MPLTRIMLTGLLLFSLGCREMTSRHSMPLPESAELQRFEGRWHDPAGSLVSIIHTGRNPRLDLWLPASSCPCFLENASLRNGEIQFSLRAEQLEESFPVTFKLLKEDRALVEQAMPGGVYFVCGNMFVIRPAELIRNPSPEWLARARAEQAAGVAAEIGREVHDGIFDWLARTL